MKTTYAFLAIWLIFGGLFLSWKAASRVVSSAEDASGKMVAYSLVTTLYFSLLYVGALCK